MVPSLPRPLAVIAAVFACASAPAWPAAVAPATEGGALDAQFVRTGLYLISGGGSNTVLRLSGDGLIIVDGKATGSYQALRRKIRRISDQPVRLLITTDDQSDRRGNDALFRADGTRVVARASTLDHAVAASETRIAGVRSTRGDDVEQLGGIEVRILRIGAAHCSADTVVYFPNLKSVVIGDLYRNDDGLVPASGGSLAGWSRALTEILRLDFDVALPSHGPAITRAQLLAFAAHIERLATSAASSGTLE